jgi:PilZ domain
MMVKPKIVYWMGLALLLIAASMPLQVAILYQHSFSELGAILQKISLLNFLCICLMATTAYLLFTISPHLKFMAPITIACLAWNNYLVGDYGQDFSLAQCMFGTGLFAGIFVPLFRQDIRLILSQPNRRWWRRAQRVNKNIEVILNPYVGQTILANTFDLSESGAFIPFENKSWDEIPKVGERIKISLHISTLRKIKCEAVVVRVVEPKGSYPKGIGVRFTDMNDTHKRSLNNFLTH